MNAETTRFFLATIIPSKRAPHQRSWHSFDSIRALTVFVCVYIVRFLVVVVMITVVLVVVTIASRRMSRPMCHSIVMRLKESDRHRKSLGAKQRVRQFTRRFQDCAVICIVVFVIDSSRSSRSSSSNVNSFVIANGFPRLLKRRDV